MSKYIGIIPLSGNVCYAAEQQIWLAAEDAREQRHGCERRRGRET